MLLVTVLYSHIVLCLDNRASDWHCLTASVCGHSLLQQSLTVAFEKAPVWAAGASLFQTPLEYEEYLLMSGVSSVPPENVLLFVFRSSANSNADTKGSLVSKDDKGPCARGAFRNKGA